VWSSLEGAGGSASGEASNAEGLFNENSTAVEAEDNIIAPQNSTNGSNPSTFASSILDDGNQSKSVEVLEGGDADDVMLSMKASSKLVFGQHAGAGEGTVEDALFGAGGKGGPSPKVVQQNGGRAQEAAAARAEVSSLLDDDGAFLMWSKEGLGITFSFSHSFNILLYISYQVWTYRDRYY